MGAYFWGYFCTSLPGGIIADRLGGRTVVGFSFIVSSILTALGPITASFGFIPFYLTRFFLGFVGVNNILWLRTKWLKFVNKALNQINFLL